MLIIDSIPEGKRYINVRVSRSQQARINNWDRVHIEFVCVSKKITNAYYINGLLAGSECTIRNIPIPNDIISIKLDPVGEFYITAAYLEQYRLSTSFEKKLMSEQLDCYNGQYFFHYPSQSQPRKLIVTLPGMGNNIDEDTQYALMSMRSFLFKEDVYRLHMVDFFWANGSCLLLNEDDSDNVENLISLIDSILVKNNLLPSDCYIVTASKGCFAGYEIMKSRSYNFAFFAPITNVDKFNQSSPVLRFTSRELLNKGFRFSKPQFSENVVVYTSLKDPGIELGLLSKCIKTIDQNLMHAQITKQFMGPYLSSNNLVE